jgi:hypothetical protein
MYQFVFSQGFCPVNCAREISRAARKCPFGAAHRVYLDTSSILSNNERNSAIRNRPGIQVEVARG